MIPLPSDIAEKDIAQWVEGCWVYKGSGTDLMSAIHKFDLVYVRRVDYGAIGPTPMLEILDAESGFISHCIPSDVYVHWPICGSVNIWSSARPEFPTRLAVTVARKQKKQWKRSYNANCTSFTAHTTSPLSILSIVDFNGNSPEVVRELFDPKYPSSYQEACSMIQSGWASVAMSPRIVLKRAKHGNLVLLDGYVIGVISQNDYFACVSGRLKRALLQELGGAVR